MTQDSKQIAEAFKAELAALLDKYKVEICVRECQGYDGLIADGIDFDFDWVFSEDHECTRKGFTVRESMTVNVALLEMPVTVIKD